MFFSTFFYLLVFASASSVDDKYISGNNRNADEALKFLRNQNEFALTAANKVGVASWNYATNLTETNQKKMLNVIEEQAELTKIVWKNATSFAWKELFKDKNETLYRWFRSLSVLGTPILPENEFKKLNEHVADMQGIYSKAKVCPYNASDKPCDLALEPELTKIIRDSGDYDELKHAWMAWRNATGKVMPKMFHEYVALTNKAARLNGFDDAGEVWRLAYESETFQKEVEELWETIRPFYENLHAYVRRKLMSKYPRRIKDDGPIPAHILGNMWAQNWGNIFRHVTPFPEKKLMDATANMNKKKLTPLDMFKMSEEFFVSLGLIPMTPVFWNKSIIEKPKNREIVCHASAWDFYDGKDFRIKMCTEVNMEDLITVHHEMGHIEYYLQYMNLPAVFRRGANPGFHEAVGDVLALSVSTPKHLKKIGLLEEVHDDHESDINTLMRMALDKVAFIPYGYMIDLWRWNIFNGKINQSEFNTKYWELRLKYQGVCPPVKRTDEDLDAAAKYHVAGNVPYIRYFVSHIIQFQFHKALCNASGHKGPLHKCDIYQNKAAGKLLNDTLSLGSSVHWKKAMSKMTGDDSGKMDAKPMLEYFEPLLKWLKKQNENEIVGWKSTDATVCP